MYYYETFSEEQNMVYWLNERNITRNMIVSIQFNSSTFKYILIYYK